MLDERKPDYISPNMIKVPLAEAIEKLIKLHGFTSDSKTYKYLVSDIIQLCRRRARDLDGVV